MKRWSTALFLCATLLLVSSVAWTTTVVQLDFDQLVAASDLIVIGEVRAVNGLEHDGRVFTHVDVAVSETLKGEPRAKLEIVHIGGRTDTLVTRVAGMPGFVVGEVALLFLEKPASVKHFVVTGLAQGKMPLRKTEDGLELENSVQRLEGVTLKQPTADLSTPQAAKTAAPKITTLAAARARIAELEASTRE